MKRLNKILALALLSLLGHHLSAQGPVRDRIKTLKVAFITEQLELTSDEAQQFWPIYNEHEVKMEVIRRNERQKFAGRLANLSEISEGDASAMLTEYLTIQEQKQQEDKRFISNLKKVISDRKIIRLLRAEEGFKKRLLQQYRQRRGNR